MDENLPEAIDWDVTVGFALFAPAQDHQLDYLSKRFRSLAASDGKLAFRLTIFSSNAISALEDALLVVRNVVEQEGLQGGPFGYLEVIPTSSRR
jgi:hypothetical protein